jgi:hypothetical protein
LDAGIVRLIGRRAAFSAITTASPLMMTAYWSALAAFARGFVQRSDSAPFDVQAALREVTG